MTRLDGVAGEAAPPAFLALVLPLLPLVRAAEPAGPAIPPRERAPNDRSEFRRLVLPNGMKVILLSDPGLNKSSASVAVGAGSLQDPAGRQGLAHFLEHMLFLGTEKYPDEAEYSKFLTGNGGYSNAYTQYVTTPEEYSLQDYEGGSTLFGPATQPAYMQELDKLAQDLALGRPSANTLTPRDLSQSQLNFQTGVLLDLPALGKRFGQVLIEPNASYTAGQTVSVRFQTGHPKNNLRRNGSFLLVQRWDGLAWQTIADDSDWATRYRWRRTLGAESVADIEWAIPATAAKGRHRIVHFGDAKNLLGQVSAFSGQTREFDVR